jgi:hypothetical protein
VIFAVAADLGATYNLRLAAIMLVTESRRIQ